AHLLAHVVGGLLHVALEHEGREDLALPLDGGGAELVEAADGVDDLLDGLGDLALDLLGGRAGQERGDGDGGQVHLGEDVHAELDEGRQPQHHQGRDDHGGEGGAAAEDLEEAHQRAVGGVAGVRPSTTVIGAPLKSWERFEIATVSPAFTPSLISPSGPCRAPAFTRRSSTLPLVTAKTLEIPTK